MFHPATLAVNDNKIISLQNCQTRRARCAAATRGIRGTQIVRHVRDTPRSLFRIQTTMKAAACVVALLIIRKLRRRRNRRKCIRQRQCWMRPLFQQRTKNLEVIYYEINYRTPQFLKLSLEEFEHIHTLVEPFIKKNGYSLANGNNVEGETCNNVTIFGYRRLLFQPTIHVSRIKANNINNNSRSVRCHSESS